MFDATAFVAAEEVRGTLTKNGFKAFLVGGCVRDLMLGRDPKDYDVTTNATPEQVMALFPKTVPVGAAFGVVVVMQDGGAQDGHAVPIEVATFRADGDYTDARRPDTVTYSETAKEDVIRRDFTMNGLLAIPGMYTGDALPYIRDGAKVEFDPVAGKVVIDYVGGMEDIKAKKIRCIGDPIERFTEDALRMLRAVRFAAQLGFDIDPTTEAAIMMKATTITKVSKERVAAELFKIVTAPYAVKGLVPLVMTGLASHVIPDVVNAGNFATTLRRFKLFPTTDPLKGMAMLLAEIGEEAAHNFCLEMKLSNEQREVIEGALRNDSKTSNLDCLTLAELKKVARRPGIQLHLDLLEQELALHKDELNPEFAEAVRKLRTFTPEEIRPAPLATGNDLIAMGLTPGPVFTKLLGEVETKQLDGVLTTNADALAFLREAVAKGV